jgi:DNA replication and repair protein RecF
MPTRVTIERLRLTAFRNYREAALAFDGRHVVLTGDNGAGKTNLLEAISFLSPGRGLRRAIYGDISRQDMDQGFAIFAAVHGMEGEVEIGTGLAEKNEAMTRRVRINGTEARSTDELLDHLRVLWLTPSMDGLFTGPAADRRRFLDRLVLSLDPGHGRRAVDFEKAMKMRNRLLEDGRYDADWLTGIERQMAELGIAMTMARAEMLSLIARIDAVGIGGAFPTASLALAGFLDDMTDAPAADLEDRYLALLREGRYRDQAAGRTLEGPHRSDLIVMHRDKNIDAARCSTGEQKALLTGLVLGHAKLTASMTGFAPVLLLDEIAAHFDETRRAALFDIISELGGQAFMTGTDRDLFKSLGERGQFFRVAHGSIAE